MEKKRAELVLKISKLKLKAKQEGIKLETVRTLLLNPGEEINKGKVTKKGSIKDLFRNSKLSHVTRKACTAVNLLIAFLILGILTAAVNYTHPGFVLGTVDDLLGVRTSRCAIENNGFFTEIARPLVKCAMCKSLTEVPIEHNISAEDFRQKYAYTAVPVLIKNATTSWSAMDTFSYNYLKEIYLSTDGALEVVEDECQFFPYKTEFETLEDAFNISEERASFKEGEKPWYIGW